MHTHQYKYAFGISDIGFRMAFTAFHCALVWPLFILRPKRFDFIGLSVGAVIPDLFIPFVYILPAYEEPVRIITHSLIGAFTFDFVLALVATLYVVPKVIRYFKNTSSDPRGYKFAGIDILEQRGSLPVIVYSILIGTTSHVLLDILYHGGSPVFYPLPSVMFPPDEVLSLEIFAHGTILLAFVYLAYVYWWKMGR
ncbi:MAG: DUF4184 family protein [Thermoplasmata archaeon]|nr:DUF4184 family protein [Thermoplasmata archaeon]